MAAKQGGVGQAGFAAVTSWSEAVRSSSDWQRFAIALISGAASVLALAPFFIWPVLFITIPNLIWLIDGVDRTLSRRQQFASAALNGWLFGFGYFSAGLFWIGEAFLAQATEFIWALPFAVTLLPAGLALFFALAVGVARLFWWPGVARILVLAVTLTIAEWLRGHVFTGFPWNIVGYALTAPLPLMQLAAVVGVYGMTAWVVVVSALPAVVAADAHTRSRGLTEKLTGCMAAVGILFVLGTYGTLRLAASPMTFVDGAMMRIVQLSVPQSEKWVPANRERIFADHLKLSGLNAEGEPDNLAGITHVVWPEVALPFLPLEIPEVMERIGAMLPDGTHLLTGGLRRDPSSAANREARNTADKGPPELRRAYNSMIVFDDTGKPALIYDKIHLVPFGEYLPFQNTLESIGLQQLARMRGGFTSGPKPRPLLNIGALKNVAGLICYEAIFPGQVSAGKRPSDRASVYINMTNDAWFGNTTGPRQHFQQARVRAVETGIPLLRAANNGISAMIGPAGRVEGRLPLNVRGTLDRRMPAVLNAPLYARFGDWVVFVQILIFCLFAALLGRISKERR